MNVLILTGRVGRDPESKDFGTSSKCTFSLATDDGWGDHKKTNWHNIELWNKSAESAQRNVKKGDGVEIVGHVEYQSWESDSGTKYKTVVKAQSWRFAPSSRKTERSEPALDSEAPVSYESKGARVVLTDTDNDGIPF